MLSTHRVQNKDKRQCIFSVYFLLHSRDIQSEAAGGVCHILTFFVLIQKNKSFFVKNSQKEISIKDIRHWLEKYIT